MPIPDPVRRRDQRLHEVGRATRLVGAAAAGAALLLGAGYAHVLPSVTSTHRPSPGQFQPPAQPPTGSTGSSHTTTGAS